MADANHTTDGKFAPGHTLGRGRPPKSRERAYQQAFHEAVTVEDWKDVIRQALKDAKKGNAAARKWLAGYLCGLPTQNIKADVDVGRVDNPYIEMSDKELIEVAQGIVSSLAQGDTPQKKPKPAKRAVAKKKTLTRK